MPNLFTCYARINESTKNEISRLINILKTDFGISDTKINFNGNTGFSFDTTNTPFRAHRESHPMNPYSEEGEVGQISLYCNYGDNATKNPIVNCSEPHGAFKGEITINFDLLLQCKQHYDNKKINAHSLGKSISSITNLNSNPSNASNIESNSNIPDASCR